MTVVNPKSISGINSITTGSGSDDLLTIHNNSGAERFRIDGSGNTRITSGIVTTVSVGAVTGDISIDDKIIHTGDTNTAIRFPSADTISFETSGGEQLRVSSGGQILGGLTTPWSTVLSSQTPKIQLESTSVSGSSMFLLRDGADTGGPFLFLGHGRGGATIVQDGDELGSITFVGADGTNFQNAAAIRSYVDGTPGSGTDMPGRLSFWTSPDGSTTLAERLRITSSGNVEVTGITSTTGLTLAKGLIQEKGKFESGGSPSGTFNHDVLDYGMIYRTSANMAGTFIFNLRGDGSTTFNSLMHIGQSAVFTAYTGSNNASYYLTDFQIDGSSITEQWNGGSAPTAGTASGTDVYTFNIMKTADATFTVFATFSNFA